DGAGVVANEAIDVLIADGETCPTETQDVPNSVHTLEETGDRGS
ncbi:hypothetical protein A2U01_0107468, partial [Trifolium medium]|nr:hypothetical protein [Trifolium medium]